MSINIDGSDYLYKVLLDAKIIDDRPIKWFRIESKVGEMPTVEVEYYLYKPDDDAEANLEFLRKQENKCSNCRYNRVDNKGYICSLRDYKFLFYEVEDCDEFEAKE
jgi:hypothetical protein